MKGRLVALGTTLSAALAATAASAQAAAPEGAPPTDVSRSGGSLSEKLSGTGGVIRPQGSVDPDMQKTPPAEGRMPVIKPPGTSGNGTQVVPK